MAFVDDDEEEDYSVPQSASNYYFEDDDKEPVSFARLPIQWTGEDKVVDGSALGLYLRGRSGDGLLPLHKLVKAWRFDLSNFRPEVSVLTKDNIWVKLEEPRKSYAELIRTVLVTLYSIQFFRRNPQASEK
ncbi:PREDICTED: protein ENHANCED DOWNY MILDEW 2-like, partial [Camelina sativa]